MDGPIRKKLKKAVQRRAEDIRIADFVEEMIYMCYNNNKRIPL